MAQTFRTPSAGLQATLTASFAVPSQANYRSKSRRNSTLSSIFARRESSGSHRQPIFSSVLGNSSNELMSETGLGHRLYGPVRCNDPLGAGRPLYPWRNIPDVGELEQEARMAKTSKLPQVGILTPADSDKTPAFAALREALKRQGLIEKESINLGFAFAKGSNNKLASLAKKLLSQRPALIITDTTMATQAVVDAGPTVPIVQAVGGPKDDIRVPSKKAPKITGLHIDPEQLSAKRLELLCNAFPQIECVTILLDLSNAITPKMLYATAQAAAKKGVRLQVLHADTPEQLSSLSTKAKQVLAGSQAFM